MSTYQSAKGKRSYGKDENYKLILHALILTTICTTIIYLVAKIHFLFAYYLGINIVTVYTFYDDKTRARQNKWRYPEKFLKFLGWIGGPVGGITGMKLFNHKISTNKFFIPYTISILIHSAIISALFYFFKQ